MDASSSFLKLVFNLDGSLSRPEIYPLSPPSPNPPAAVADDPPTPYVLSKGVPLNPSNHTWFRTFLPHLLTPSPTASLPVIIDFHGGGFVLFSAASAPSHASCEFIARGVPAIVLSVEYRLAPEHRLPAAYDDAIDVVRWVRDQAASAATSDPWMALADFSHCFLLGSSVGGKIAYRATLQALEQQPPFEIVGVILNQPYFGGIERTESELRLETDRILPLRANDSMWELALPRGADKDHEFYNAVLASEKDGGQVGRLPACLVRGYGGDPLLDRQVAMARMLKERGVRVVRRFHEEGCHGVELFDVGKAEAFFSDVRDFVSSSLRIQPPPPPPPPSSRMRARG
ncbi:hypothetical protein ACLOJK_001983 [Asimina triloba]